MVRNFDHRFEVITPIYDNDIQQELMDMINIQLADNVKARYVNGNPNNRYKKVNAKNPARSQFATYEYLKDKWG